MREKRDGGIPSHSTVGDWMDGEGEELEEEEGASENDQLSYQEIILETELRMAHM